MHIKITNALYCFVLGTILPPFPWIRHYSIIPLPNSIHYLDSHKMTETTQIVYPLAICSQFDVNALRIRKIVAITGLVQLSNLISSYNGNKNKNHTLGLFGDILASLVGKCDCYLGNFNGSLKESPATHSHKAGRTRQIDFPFISFIHWLIVG